MRGTRAACIARLAGTFFVRKIRFPSVLVSHFIPVSMKPSHELAKAKATVNGAFGASPRVQSLFQSHSWCLPPEHQRIPRASPSFLHVYCTQFAFLSARSRGRVSTSLLSFPLSLLDLRRRRKSARALAGTLAPPPPPAMNTRASFGLVALLSLVLLVAMNMKIQYESLEVRHFSSLFSIRSLLFAAFSPLDLDQMGMRQQSFESTKVRGGSLCSVIFRISFFSFVLGGRELVS